MKLFTDQSALQYFVRCYVCPMLTDELPGLGIVGCWWYNVLLLFQLERRIREPSPSDAGANTEEDLVFDDRTKLLIAGVST